MKKSIISLFIACALFFGGTMDARADYPKDKPITVIVPFGARGGVDVAAHILADYFQKNYGITVNVVNRPGRTQAIGINEMLRAEPDGYTVAFAGFPSRVGYAAIDSDDFTLDDLKPVAHVTGMEFVLSTHKASDIDTLEKFIEAAENNPAGTNFGTIGENSIQRLYMAKLLTRFHNATEIRHIPYESGNDVTIALFDKLITAGFQVPANILPYARVGSVNALAVSRKERDPALPDTPTFRELYADRLTPEDESWIDLNAWHGIIMSHKVKDEHATTLMNLIKQAMEDPEVIKKFHRADLSVDYLPAEEFGKMIRNTTALVEEMAARLADLKEKNEQPQPVKN